jgi:aryl-alcohol dehydrogenase-like predicted oxidoreductase
MAKALGLTVTAWSPLGSGILTGKHSSPGMSSGSRLENEAMKQFAALDQRKAAIVIEVQAVAKQLGRSPAQVALAWLRHRDVPVIPIVGARKVEQVKDNLACVDVKLESDQLRRLEEASRIELGFPHDFYTKDMVRTFAYGGTRDLIDA